MTVQPALLPARASRWPTSPPGNARVGGPTGAPPLGAPTLTKTPIERGSVARRDGRRVNRGNGSCFSSVVGRSPGATLPRGRGPVDRRDRRSLGSLLADGEGVLLRPIVRYQTTYRYPQQRQFWALAGHARTRICKLKVGCHPSASGGIRQREPWRRRAPCFRSARSVGGDASGVSDGARVGGPAGAWTLARRPRRKRQLSEVA